MTHEPRFQMYTYYGSVSFQIVSIFFAAAFVLATLPVTNLPKSVGEIAFWRTAIFPFDLMSESFAFVLAIVGILFFRYLQRLADGWSYGVVEAFERQIPRGPITGKHYVWIFFIAVLLYCGVALSFLIWMALQ